MEFLKRESAAEVKPTFAVVTDSVADLPYSLYNAFDVRVVPLHVDIDGVDYRDGVDVGPHEYLDLMARAKSVPKTSQPAPAAFEEAYEAAIAEGYTDIVSVHIAASISGTYECARMVAAQVCAMHPGIRIEVVDSYTASVAQGVLVLECALMARRGKTLDDAVSYVLSTHGKVQFLFVPGSYDNLVAGGRVSKIVGVAASMLDIKVVIKTCEDCHMDVEYKARGINRAMRHAAQYLAKRSHELGELVYWSVSSNAMDLLDHFERELAQTDFAGRRISFAPIGPVIASQIGLGAFGLVSMPAALYDKELDMMAPHLAHDFS